MGNQISRQPQNNYQQYMESSNEFLTDMVANLNTKSLEEIGKLFNTGDRNSQALFFISNARSFASPRSSSTSSSRSFLLPIY